jgi:hypothetical protein
MNLIRLALRNIAGNSFRSFVVLLCALLISGMALTTLAVVLFRKLIIATLGIPFLVPALPMLAALILGGLACSLLTVMLAAMLPVYRISHEDPAIAMRE